MNPVVNSLIVDGVFAGVGSVLSFLPVIVVLFFLSLYAGRQRLYGTGGFCDGQAAAARRTVGTQLCADADWFRLFGAGDYGCAYITFGKRPQADHIADAFL